MNIIGVENITKSYTERKLFDKASFYLQEGEKVGVIGINGTGKSTLLKILGGLEEPDEGTVTKANHIVVKYLPQNPVFDPEMSVIDSVIAGYVQNSVGSMSRENQNEGNAAKNFPGDINWNLESDAKSMMTRLGIYDFAQKTGELSGGQRKRLALVAALLAPCDVLILDEPTNHLDSAMADWLEDFLKKWRGTLVMVTHDRYFLDSVCNRIVEVDKGSIYSYDTNYSGYLERKAEREDIALASERKRQSILRKELEWVKRGARARTTKQKGRLQRYEELKNQSALDADDRVEMSSVYARMGKTTVELSHICKQYDDKLLIKDFSYIFLKGDRVGFVGANGSGKTTLMKLIAGRIKPDSGTITVGQTIKLGYYTQEIETEKEAGIAYMDPDEKVIDYIKNTAEYVRTTDGLVSASNMLERFLFPSSQQYSPIGKLSGGEKRRLNLLRVLMEAPNVLILDEPTNDLDTRTLAILEDYLDSYEGIVIVVSHDRYFLDRVTHRIFAFEENGEIRQYEGGYTDYVNRLAAEGRTPGGSVSESSKAASADLPQEKDQAKNSKVTWKSGEKKLKFSYKEQREYETIEDDIADLEKKIEQLDADMAANATNSLKLGELLNEKGQTEALLEEKMERWEYLEELAARIAEQNL
ncbi:MAG: ABC-F family ATP-binding cassette domain-containing protein [Clostridiales bacterium]|nr:ABC-F family ATP-binding cassette domain-containing protein [Roseburia sp.]MDD7635400.1 ABC-F family ATP-binding cassette domain-containing protein [Clostridiales bacterium]MDY4112691.1 ABC-F family ATP-binding cassette domain-containing protein [Roseburia sp.]